MVTYHLSDNSISAVVGPGEINNLHALINSCLISNGLEPWERISVEAFELGSSCLIFARPGPPAARRLYGSFPRLKRY